VRLNSGNQHVSKVKEGKMNNHQPMDPFTHHVMQQIDPNVRASLTPAQLSAIKKALMARRPMKQHTINVRTVIPLFFARYYFVLLLGRDRRVSTKRVEEKRRWASSFSGGLMFFILGLSPLILLVLLLSYIFKSVVGIDIMPDIHLKDIFTFWQ
jgi:hypothetical protein